VPARRRVRPSPPPRPRLISSRLHRSIVAALALAGCAPAVRPNANLDGRLRFVASQATQASWSFRVDDRARGGELLVDGRPRDTGCSRAGREIRCELRGLFPGGHVVELRLPGALLRRTVLIGRPWPARPQLVRAQTPEEATQAIDAGADGIVLDARGFASPVDLSDLVDVVHLRSGRAVVIGDARAIEYAGADALLGDAVPAELIERFPEARTLTLDGPVATLDAALAAHGLVEARGLSEAALAQAAPHGAIVDRAAFPLLTARKRHAALRTGAASAFAVEAGHLGLKLEQGRDAVLALVNTSDAPWTTRPPPLAAPTAIVGALPQNGELTVPAHDAIVLAGAPPADQTRY
jgi:hypothetical protein